MGGEQLSDGAQWTAEKFALLGSAFVQAFEALRVPEFIENPLRNPFEGKKDGETGEVVEKKEEPEPLPLFPGEQLIPKGIRDVMEGDEDSAFSPENLKDMEIPLDVESLKPPGFPKVDDLMGKLPMPDGIDLPDMKELKKDLKLPDT